MAGANVTRLRWATYQAGVAVAANFQALLVSLGTGWFVTRIKGTYKFVAGPIPEQMPANTTISAWPAPSPLGFLFGVHHGPTGYGGLAPSLTNANDPGWLLYEEVPPATMPQDTRDNPPYIGFYPRYEGSWDILLGAVPQAVAEDFYLSYGFPVGVTIPITEEGFFTGTAELWYG